MKAKSQAFRVCFPLRSLLVSDKVSTYKPLLRKVNEKEKGYIVALQQHKNFGQFEILDPNHMLHHSSFENET